MEVVKELLNNSGDRKVEIYRRENGTFGFEAFKYSSEEECWFPYGIFSHGIFESMENAMSEAQGRIKWLL